MMMKLRFFRFVARKSNNERVRSIPTRARRRTVDSIRTKPFQDVSLV